MKSRRGLFRGIGWVVTAGFLVVAIAAPSTVQATKPDATHKVTICHATNADRNPYVMETVDIASSGHLRGGHDTRHTGPIWLPGLKAQHIAWGDIIPPYTYQSFSYPGQNWTEEGQSILANDCEVPQPTPTPTRAPTPTPTEAPTPTPSPTPTATPEPEVTPTPTPTTALYGETPTPSPTETPEGTVEGETGATQTGSAAPTPPATDAMGTTMPSDPGWRWALVGLSALLALSLLLTRPVVRRS